MSYLNSMKLVYQILLSSNFRAWPWKLSEYLKESIPTKNGPKRLWLRQPKITQNQCNFPYIREEKKTFFNRFFCNMLKITSLLYLKYFFANFLIVWKQYPELLFLNLNLTVLHSHLVTTHTPLVDFFRFTKPLVLLQNI